MTSDSKWTGSDQWPSTQRQHEFLLLLAGQRKVFGADVPRDVSVARMRDRVNAGLTMVDASRLIDEAKKCDPFPAEVIPAQPHTVRALRSRAQTHALFGLGVSRDDTIARVEQLITDGLCERDGQELVHSSYRAKPHPTVKSAFPIRVVSDDLDGVDVFEGRFAVMVEGTLRFYRVEVPARGEYEGELTIARYSSDNLIALTPSEVVSVLKSVAADPDTAAYRFSDEFTRCFVCGRRLTDQVSRLLSVGPTCRGFTDHAGLRSAAADVDANPRRRYVYRALRSWAVEQGFRDPRNREERETMSGQLSASRLASAWSGLPGILDLDPDVAVTRCKAALKGDLHPDLEAALLAADPETLAILVASGVLTGDIMYALASHPDPGVQESAAQALFAALHS